MNWLVWRVVLRALAREKGRTLLSLGAIALGVSVFLAIRLANAAAVASFEQFTQGVGQGSDVVLRAEAGALKEAELPRLLPALEHVWMRPVLEGSFARLPSQEAFEITGIDLVGFADGLELPPATATPSSSESHTTFLEGMRDPHAVWISTDLARVEGLKPGDALEGMVDDRPVTLRIAGILPDLPHRPPLQRHLLVMDLPAAQTLLHRIGVLDRVEIGLRPGQTFNDVEPQLQRLLPPGWVLESPEQRAESGRTMSAAFRFNLEVLSLIGLAVGSYLLFQAFDAAVHRRRHTWSTLRTLGLRPWQLRRLVLWEALVLGLLGSALGVMLGWLLAQGAVHAVSRTVAALYGPSAATQAGLSLREVSMAIGAGLVACIAAAWVPAREAALTPPLQGLSRSTHSRPLRWQRVVGLGLLMLAAGFLLAFHVHPAPGVAWHAYLGALLLLGGGSLAALGLLPLLGRLGRTEHWGWALALRPLQRPTGRHGWSTAALTVAMGMAVGMGVMVKSFERTVMAWTESVLRADLFVAPFGAQGASSHHRLSESLAAELASDPAVADMDRFQSLPIPFRGKSTLLGAGDMEVHARRGHLELLGGLDSKEVMQQIHRDGVEHPGALASETFCRRFGVSMDQQLVVPTPTGAQSIRIRGIYADYGNERGSLVIDRPVFFRWYQDARIASLAVYLKPGSSMEAVAERWRAAHPGLQIRSNAGLRSQVSTIFHQTFALTYALEIIGLAVALAGLVEALLGLALERRGELHTLRSLGARPREIAGVLLGEGLGVAASGLLGGLAVGLLLAQVLVRVLNPQVFGWTLAFHIPWSSLIGLCLASLAIAVAALWPAARFSARLPVDREAEEGA